METQELHKSIDEALAPLKRVRDDWGKLSEKQKLGAVLSIRNSCLSETEKLIDLEFKTDGSMQAGHYSIRKALTGLFSTFAPLQPALAEPTILAVALALCGLYNLSNVKMQLNRVQVFLVASLVQEERDLGFDDLANCIRSQAETEVSDSEIKTAADELVSAKILASADSKFYLNDKVVVRFTG